MLGVEQSGELIAGALLRHDPVADVRPVEAGDEHPGVAQLQPLPDLPPRLLVGGRGQGDPRHGRKALVQHRELEVLRTEVVAPLRHAVRLVDREERDVDLVEQHQRPFAEQPLGGHVEEVDRTGAQPRLDVEHRPVVERRVEARRPHPGLDEPGDLIAHQGDEGRDDDSGPRADERRNLVAERLAAACRHQHEAVAAPDGVLDDRFLLPPEPVVAEDAAQQIAYRGAHPAIVLRGRRRSRSGATRPVSPRHELVGNPVDDDGSRRRPALPADSLPGVPGSLRGTAVGKWV